LLNAAEYLQHAWHKLEPELADILEAFYGHVSSIPELAKKLSYHIPRLKDAQVLHWKRLFSGNFDQEYMTGVYSVGAAHRRIGVDIRWYISSYQFLLNRFVAVLGQNDFPKNGLVTRTMIAAVMLDIELAIEAYRDEMDLERSQQVSRIATQMAQEMEQKFDEVTEVLVRRPRPNGTQIRKGLRNGEFYLLYQPIVRLDSGQCAGAEVLVRWETSDGNHIPPDQFIPVAEERGLIRSITRFVVERVAEEAGSLMHKHSTLHLSINFSKDDMESLETMILLKDLCKQTDLKPKNFWIEATERGFLKLNRAGPILQSLRDEGFAVAIDDVGTGYSSLSSLASLPITHLKIDKAFVDPLPSVPIEDGLTHHIIEIAKTLGLELVAEGIERDEQRLVLLDHGVTFGQGWLFSQPLTMDQLSDFVERQP
jgi:EAL domain-containing protein (putative c-di-GMP-specific phosphodiesterase class I)